MTGFKKLGYDILPVLVGVLLALFINNFQESIKEKRFIKKVVQIIVAESKTNIANIQKGVERQRQFMDSLNFYLDRKDISIVDIIKKANGVHTPDVANNGASFLLNTNQTLVEVDLLMKLSEVNISITSLKANSERAIDKLYDLLNSHHKEDKKRISLMFHDLINHENEVIKACKAFNEKYGKPVY